MVYFSYYNSPIGKILLASRNGMLIQLSIEGQRYYEINNSSEFKEKDDEEILLKTKKWLDRYFKGDIPNINELKLDFSSYSSFRQEVWKLLLDIPYGKTVTYSEIAKKVAYVRGKEKMSAQAIGGAIGHNPISIIVPCHRVIGKNGNLVGYSGGIDMKIKLLKHEGIICNE